MSAKEGTTNTIFIITQM